MNDLAEAWRYRALLTNFVRRDLRVRYKNSFLGFGWSLLNPLFQILVYVLVFRYMWGADDPNYSVKLFVAMLPWLFFSQALLDGAATVAQQVAFIKKVYFPRILLPVATLCSNFVHFLLGLVVLAVFFALRSVTVAWPHMGLALAGLAIMTTFLFGLMLSASAISVYYNDVKFLLGTVVQMWFFLSPVLLPPDRALQGMASHGLPPIMQTLYLLNPLAPPIIAYRTLIPHEGAPGVTNDYLVVIQGLVPNFMTYFAISGLVAVASVAVGYLIFQRLQPHFAEQG